MRDRHALRVDHLHGPTRSLVDVTNRQRVDTSRRAPSSTQSYAHLGHSFRVDVTFHRTTLGSINV
jgi:hypothetical protein